jgi:signal transduction histidine kinase
MPARRTSLRLRLALFAALAISLLLGLAGAGFALLFQRHVEQFAVSELNTHFEQLASGLGIDVDGGLMSAAALSDPRFEQPQSGMYWQVDTAGRESLRSRSLWDETLNVPTPPISADDDHAHVMPGPNGVELLALEKLVVLEDGDGKEVQAVVTIGMERNRVDTALSGFGQSLAIGLGLLYAGLLAATLAMVFFVLRPLQHVRHAVTRLRTGQASRISEAFPDEVSPLVSEVNALVEARENQLDRARQRAGNLAHGLKTPLTVLSAVANDLTDAGMKQEAESIATAAGQMRDLIERELARSRMAAGSTAHRTQLRVQVLKVVETLRRAPMAEKLEWRVEVEPEAQVAVDSVDLLELLGNLLDNARKHARSNILVRHDGLNLTVEDDGPGVPSEKLATIARRGVKLDSLSPGSGLGLSIVSDLAEAYGLHLEFRTSKLGGLAASVSLPTVAN